MHNRLLLPGTLLKLGLGNVARVVNYKLSLKMGVNPALKAQNVPLPMPIFRGALDQNEEAIKPVTLDLLGWHRITFDNPPNWAKSYFPNGKTTHLDLRWDKALAVLPEDMDVKEVWELSRWGWMAALAQIDDTATLNAWVIDWLKQNPPFMGLNWSCGQEAALRIMHLALAAILLGQHRDPEPSLLALVRIHLDRIAPTIGYAIAQDNNHGSSEAAGLFVGGIWTGEAILAEMGRHLLEDRSQVLFQADGSSNQYSVTYHRTVLETYCFVELWRRIYDLPLFSSTLYSRLARASHWLRQATDPNTGDAPNIGSNDGSHVLQTAGQPYRDFRPTVQLATALFTGLTAYASDGSWDQPLMVHKIKKPAMPAPVLQSESFDDGGYHILRDGQSTAWMRYPRFRYRPAQADALHVDLWVSGRPVLIDGGSYSYAKPEGVHFSSTSAHNTVVFDQRDQMPKLSRFLYGAWLEAEDVVLARVEGGRVVAGAAYTDRHGARHARMVQLSEEQFVITDTLDGSWKQAMLHWHLAPGAPWQLDGNRVTNGIVNLTITAGRSEDLPPRAIRMRQGQTSPCYLQALEVPVLEVALSQPGILTTTVDL